MELRTMVPALLFLSAACLHSVSGAASRTGPKVTEKSVVHTIELQDTNDRNLPYTECVVVNSGRIPVKEPFVVEVEGW
ncbi:hypothetical protein KUCAC02_029282 [Chaenocephalus aceratus]|uniref:Uncharacterized protein n=1 Tax=Chaenocephalus aceratus TaxID=36190 RepID=A0ACB9X538_CHAAC|nr:hypothetical protein KUCAC02_029282 [Chaenocephalus aceratus]